jgi:hypothetical protein
MTLSEIWKSLDNAAVPKLRAEVEKRGWKLRTEPHWSGRLHFIAYEERAGSENIGSVDPDELLKAIDWEMAERKRWGCCDGECPECFGSEGEP